MRETRHVNDLLEAYSLGCLDPREARHVSAHLRGCPQCRSELARWDVVTACIGYAAPPLSPPPDFESRLLATYRAEMTRSKRLEAPPRSLRFLLHLTGKFLVSPSIAPAALAACLLLIAVLGALDVVLLRRIGFPAFRGESSVAVSLRGTASAPSANATVFFSGRKTTGVFVVSRLAPLPPGREYQLWMYKDDERINGGVFSVDDAGAAAFSVSAPYPLSECRAYAVTVEPAGGSPAPTGLSVLNGTL
jgi:anti-sigma-K factor RskA